MQVCKNDAGQVVVIHKIRYGNGRMSAWFDTAGTLLDVERFDKRGRHAKVTDDARYTARRALYWVGGSAKAVLP
jgi:hypothetical protein